MGTHLSPVHTLHVTASMTNQWLETAEKEAPGKRWETKSEVKQEEMIKPSEGI